MNEALVTSIKSWLIDEQPRQKLLTKGVATLSNSELLSIVINIGVKERSALDIAHDLMKICHNNLDEIGRLSLSDIRKINGMGEGKAAMIVAAIELGRRRYTATALQHVSVRSSAELADYLRTLLKDSQHELFAVLYLNRANKIKNFEIISIGGMTGTVADPRIILKRALEENATSLVLSHNHPSGNLRPSRADEELTIKIKQAASYMDIKILDHIIVSNEGYFSFADEGLL
jgi:DNA repair protein RadC